MLDVWAGIERTRDVETEVALSSLTREAQYWTANQLSMDGLPTVADTGRFIARNYPGGWVTFTEHFGHPSV